MLAHSWAFAFALLLSMTNAFSATARANPVSPPGCEMSRNIEYARVGDTSLRLDACIPQGVTSAPAAIIVHGGGWVRGNREIDVAPLFKPLSDAGFAWFSIDYRLATDVTQFGAAIDDVEQAIRFVDARAAEFHVDRQRLVVIGESAGGQLAAMAALRGTVANIKAVVALYTPTDLVTLIKNSDYIPARIRQSVEGTPWEALLMAGLAQLSPINSVRRDMPAFLFIHGTDDPLVPFAQSREMCARMRKAGATCEVFPVEGAGHGIRWWESYPEFATAYKRKMIEWLRSQLGGLEAVSSKADRPS